MFFHSFETKWLQLPLPKENEIGRRHPQLTKS